MGRLIDGAIDITSRNRAPIGGVSRRPRGSTKYLIIHYTAGDTVQSAVDTLNKKQLAYHYFVDKDNKVYLYTPDNVLAYHAGNINNDAVSISLVGGGPDTPKGPYLGERDILRRPSQIQTAVQLGEELIQKYDIKRQNIYGHGELPGAGKMADEGITAAVQLRAGTPKAPLPPDAGKPGKKGSGRSGVSSGSPRPSGIAAGPDPFASSPPISPYIATVESLHPFIQYELTRRRNAAETANIYMPFVKLTSLSRVLKSNLGNSAAAEYCKNSPDGEAARQKWIETCADSDTFCPTLGIHGEPQGTFDDIFSTKSNRSIVAYASQKQRGNIITRVPVLVADAAKDPPNIPPPGITSLTAERSTAGPMGVRGGLFKATINIRAYSVGQVDTLLRYFLRPATRVVLELGRKSSNTGEEIDTTSTMFNTFNWKRSLGTDNDGNDTTISGELGPLVTLKKGQRDFIEKYIYGNLGNYEIFIGYVVRFDLKFTKENGYDISLIIHSLQQYEVPVAGTGINSLNPSNSVPNPCDAVDIVDYFNPPSGWRRNTLKKLMTSGKGVTQYPTHIIELVGPGTNTTSGGAESSGWLVTWQFFVDVMLNDTEEGILSVFQLGEEDQKTKDFLKSSVIRPIQRLVSGSKTSLNANEVSWSPTLRSVDPNVMIIYSPSAQTDSIQTNIEEITQTLESLGDISEEDRENIILSYNSSSVQQRIMYDSPVGGFTEVDDSGTSYLTKGVWLNTNAIMNAFSGADTISVAINNLLTAMNNATRGFWNLQLLSNDVDNPGMHVIDAGISKKPKYLERRAPERDIPQPMEQDIFNVQTSDINISGLVEGLELGAKDEKGMWHPNHLYVFNRKLQTSQDDDIGGELLDVTLESSLPQVIAVQAIAGVGGQMQRGTLNAIDIEELRSIALYDVYPKENNVQSNSPCAPTPTDAGPRPSEIPQEFVNLIIATLGGQRISYNNEIADASDISRIQQELIDEWKGKLSVCKEPGENVDDAGKLAMQKLCEEEVRNRTKVFDDYRGKLGQSVRESYETQRPGYLSLVKQYSGMYGSAIDLIEYDVSKMSKNLDSESQVAQQEGKPHSFNSSNLTKTLVNLTMPGIGGIQLFQSFGVDRVPSILDRGYYVVTKVDHDFSVENGWTTKVQGRFRYNPPTPTARVERRQPPAAPASPTLPTTPVRRPAQAPVTEGTLSAEQQASLKSVSKPVNQFTNQEIVNRTNIILGLTSEFWGKWGRSSTRIAYEQRLADGTIDRLKAELILLDDEATRRVRSQGLVPREFRGSYLGKLQDRLEERNIRLRG